MSLRLDVPREQALERAAEIVAEAWRSFDHARADEPPIDDRLRALLDGGAARVAASVLEVLEDARRALDETIAQVRPRFFAFVASSGLEIGVLGDLLASCFDANLAVWAAAASEIEDQAVRWVAEFVGFPAAAGAFTSGGTVSNMTALAAARERAIPGLPPPRARRRRRRRSTAPRRRTTRSSARPSCSGSAPPTCARCRSTASGGSCRGGCRRRSAADRAAGRVPVAVVATAGTTLTGAVDPIGALADVCAEAGVWLHVDGAYGLPAATTPSAGHLFAGLDRADSVTLDAHKWLYLPKACGVLLVRRRDDLVEAFAHEEAYIPHERTRPHGRHHARVLAPVPGA